MDKMCLLIIVQIFLKRLDDIHVYVLTMILSYGITN